MTGLGRASEKVDGYDVNVIIQSVNHKSLDSNIRLPANLKGQELLINKEIKKYLSRGRIDVLITVDENKESESIHINEQQVRPILESLNTLSKEFPKININVSLEDLWSYTSLRSNSELEIMTIKVFHEALSDFVLSKTREGEQLALVLAEEWQGLKDLLHDIKSYCDLDGQTRFKNLKDRATNLCGQEIKEDRLYQELALLVERSDFKEEIDRLMAHLEHMKALLEEKGIKGRKIDFLCQEMLRECTTLISKAHENHVMIKGIDLKFKIERIREQIQNIE
jgi:uncharacterized protein (TIGR00255 family)